MVALARVTKPVGLHGGVRVTLLCDGPDRLLDVQRIYRGKEPRDAVAVTLQEVSARGNGVVVFFGDCSSRSDAEHLRDHYLFISEQESLPSQDDRPRVHELDGCIVETTDGRKLGSVTNVYDLPAYRLLGVTEEREGREVLVPYVEAWIVEMDRKGRRVVLTSDELFDDV